MESLLLALFVFTHLLHLHSAEEMKQRQSCPPFTCGKLAQLRFPFNNSTSHECGLCSVSCSESQEIQFEPGGRWYHILNISQANIVRINDSMLTSLLKRRSCDVFNHLTLPNLSYVSYRINPSLQIYKCNNSLRIAPPRNFNSTTCGDFSFYYSPSNDTWPGHPPPCPVIQLPGHRAGTYRDLFTMLTAEFSVEVKVRGECYNCYYQRSGQCQNGNQGNFHCSVGIEATKGRRNLKLLVGSVVGIGLVILISIFAIVIVTCYKRKKFVSRNSADLSSKSNLEGGSAYFGVPVFSHSELEEATNNFDSEKELGDGGFGIVYHGKLRDGREVAVKRLFEHNYKRVQQFMNEIKILTLLRHKNLVTLYGCTSRRSHELLLVYEYIPNGTVADHLHGEGANSSSLTWSIRMNIAIETASALAYLHASEIIHRDVKTNNILLDNNFCVKVADFGLSRLFPIDVTHVSTAPQGTPGYVDPDYHQCYQLTNKSDVYSFGVVLIELISSMPAVDISRHRHEINLASYAIHKIQKCAFDELIDPCLGYQSDEEVRRMTTSIAELAFRCLQQDKEMRPTMEEVFEELQRIQSGEHKLESENIEEQHHKNSAMSQSSVVKQQPPTSPECDEVSLLENAKLPPASPISVTDKWISTQTTPNASS